ncbi:MAG: hypothetical protein JXR48_15320 [Candidatus Delongbacteria bacterium]|nr:hypothetical protein [Candidatus Delongbacteria bacterium]MBN2836325.1 hypothetical protein [Candidatus Delongbacteria bacterium]
MKIKIQNYFVLSSGYLIVFIGVVFLISKFIHKHKSNNSENKSIWFVGFAAGIIPCPVSLTITLFSLANDLLFIGLLAVISISVGMFILLCTTGILTILFREKAISFSARFTNRFDYVSIALEYISIVLIILIGLIMIL